MQNWKIKRMSEERINEWLNAINELIEIYESKARVQCCPFCELLEFGSCLKCLWHIIELISCTQFAVNLGFHSALGARDEKKWRNIRIPMLSRWKKMLKIELARREE